MLPRPGRRSANIEPRAHVAGDQVRSGRIRMEPVVGKLVPVVDRQLVAEIGNVDAAWPPEAPGDEAMRDLACVDLTLGAAEEARCRRLRQHDDMCARMPAPAREATDIARRDARVVGEGAFRRADERRRSCRS